MNPFFMNGEIISITPTQVFGNFKKREFVLRTDTQYPEDLKFEFVNDNVDVMDKYIVGEMVTVAFIPKGSSNNGRHFIQLRAVAICEILYKRVEQENKKLKSNYAEAKRLLESGVVSSK